jgi:3-dehydroquinate synthase
MNELERARQIINEVDTEMASLFEKRMDAAREVAEYKKTHGLSVDDFVREADIIKHNTNYIKNEEYRPYYKSFLQSNIDLSKRFQHKLLGDMYVACSGSVNGGYDIILERGALQKVNELLDLDRKVLIVTDDGVPEAYAKVVASQCKEAEIVTIPQGEQSKNIENWSMLLKALVENNFTRSDCVVAVGGGVVGDLAGFAASSFMRGIDFYNIPTTLLSQVDSSIGGKTAVDFMGYKNLVGAFYPPKKVVIDPYTLRTLPQRQLTNGLCESIKMGLTSDKELYEIIAKNDLDDDTLDEIIYRSLLIKKAVVEADEREGGLRKVLNFGHTIAHAIESINGLEKYYHGECVGIGMLPMCSQKVR